MKRIILLSSAAVLAAVFHAPAWAAEPVPPTEPAAPAPPPPSVRQPLPPVPAVPAMPAVPGVPSLPNLGPMLNDLQNQLQNELAQVGAAVQDIVRAAPGGFGGGGFGGGGELFHRPVGRPGRTVVIPGGQMGSKATESAEEDLNVMARLLEKALASREDRGADRRAMGIGISMLAPSSSAPRNLYLDGYGAVFFLEVNFPLLPPPKPEPEPKDKEPVSSEWEEAQRELDAARSPEGKLGFKNWPGFGNKNSAGDGAEYDAERVEQLKDTILESLKNVTHIRELKPEESVTVVVTSAANARGERHIPRRSSGDGRTSRATADAFVFASDSSRAAAGRPEATLTVRVKKSEADAFAKGKIDLDGFRKQASLRIY